MNTAPGAAPPDARRSIPFEYSFEYELKGTPGNVVNKTVSVSIEGPFVAVSIGYGVLPRVEFIDFGPDDASDYDPADFRKTGSLPDEVPVHFLRLDGVLRSFDRALRTRAATVPGEPDGLGVLRDGIRLNPDLAEIGLRALQTGRIRKQYLGRLLQTVTPTPERVQFKYAIFDEGSGREFQSDPILSTAGLGAADGDRPFRYFARPITFEPRSTIRIQVTEVTRFPGELHIALHGYKSLGGEGTPTSRLRPRRRRGR